MHIRTSGERRDPTAWRIRAIVAVACLGAPAIADGGDALSELRRIESAVEQLVQQVSGSVVGLRVERRYAPPAQAVSAALPDEPLVTVNGAGAILDSDGLILTNEHVVQHAETITVLFSDGSSAPATVRGSDPRADLAVLEVSRRGLSAARVADASGVARGQWTVAMGNPYGLGGDGEACVSVGVISNLGRRLPGLGEVDDRLYGDMIQTTAAIHPGNSGGPLFNLRGELIGVVTAMHTRAVLDEGVGFAIPLSESKLRVIDRLRRGERVEYGYVGLSVRDANSSAGVVVEDVEAGGPADAAGVRRGDRILQLDGSAIHRAADMVDRVGALPVGATCRIRIARDGREQTLSIVAARRAASRAATLRGHAVLWRGLRLTDLAEAAGRPAQRVAEGGVLVVDVVKDSPGDRSGIRIGDVIESVDSQRVADLAAFRERTRAQAGVVHVGLSERGEILIQP